MPPIRRPSVRLLQLARELARLRDEAGITREQVCDATGISSPTLSRIENAGTTINPQTVAELLDLYGVPAARKAALIELAKNAQKRGWWLAYRDVLKGGYVGMEHEASDIFAFEPLIIPGLLQTGEYIRALISASPHSSPDESDERRVQARIARQALLTRAEPPRMHFVLGEAALHQLVGGAEVMRRQLVHLWDLAQRDHVTIQIVPFSAGAHRSMEGSFTMLTFADLGMEIGYTEGPGGGIYLESQADLAEINLRRESLHKVALSPIDSAEVLRDFADRTRE